MASNVPTDESATSDDNNIENQVQLVQQLTNSLDKDKQFMIVTAGKAGVGKSTLINNFLQLEGDAAFEARLDPNSVTATVTHTDRVINGVQVRMIDVPGLHAADSDDMDIIGDLKGITSYKDVAKGVDVIFYCINLLSRLDKIDYENMDTLTNIFGSEIWEHAIFVFTYTDVVLSNGSSLEELIGNYIEALQNHLVEKRKVNVEIKSIYSFQTDAVSENADIDTYNGIIGIPVSNNPAIPPNWRITLLLQILRKCRNENIPALLKLSKINWDEVIKTALLVVASAAGVAALRMGIRALTGAPTDGIFTEQIGEAEAVSTVAKNAATGSKNLIETLGTSGSVSLTALLVKIARVIRTRRRIEERARRKTEELLRRENRLAQAATTACQDQA